MDKQTIRNDAISIGAGTGVYFLSKRLGFQSVKTTLQPLRVKAPQDRIEPLKCSINELIRQEQLDRIDIRFFDMSKPENIALNKKSHNAKLFSIKRKIVSTKNPIKKFILFNKYKETEKMQTHWIQSMIEGLNGCYVNKPKNKRIEINLEKGPHIFFHEAGHAIDYTKPYLEKIFSSYKKKNVLRLPIVAALLTALVTPENKECKNYSDKINSFVKKHCGILATIGYLPMMACETSANIRGQLLAKKYAPADLKLLTKTHLYSLACYWSKPLVIWLSVWAANKARDKVAQKLKHSDQVTSKS